MGSMIGTAVVTITLSVRQGSLTSCLLFIMFTQGANHHIFVTTDMVCYKRLLYMVGFLRPLATTSGWTTFSIGYCNSEIQDGVQDGRHNLILQYYHRLLLYFRLQCIVSMVY